MKHKKAKGAALIFALSLMSNLALARTINETPLSIIMETGDDLAVTTEHLMADLTVYEGIRYKAYRDSRGIWTIGIGHNIEADPKLMAKLQYLIKTGLTKDEVRALFEEDVQKSAAELDKAIPWWRTLDDVRQDALLNVCFNLGCQKLINKWPNFIKAMKNKDFKVAAANIRSNEIYNTQVGIRAVHLAKQIETGVRALS